MCTSCVNAASLTVVDRRCGCGQTVWVRMSGALFLGSFWHQLAFIGHDVGHNAITHNKAIDSRIGLFVGNMCTGVSMGACPVVCVYVCVTAVVAMIRGCSVWCAVPRSVCLQ